MKKDIHPTYYPDAKVTCACGASFTMGSTEKEIHVEICSACHPFYSGKEKLLDTAGRVDKFKERMEAAAKFKQTKVEKASKSEEKVEKKEKSEKTTDK
jgi:large subunit ribosomal protein L31